MSLSPTPLETPCRVWRGALSNGYGSVRREGRTWKLHRWIWTLVNGPIPDGMCVLHRCDNRPCFRIDHLFLGSKRENAVDASEKGRLARANKGLFNPDVTQCPQGHPYEDDNLYIDPDGHRRCRACNADRGRKLTQRKRASCPTL